MNHDEMIMALQTNAGQLEAMVVGLDEETLQRRPAEGGWSVKEVVGHLRDAAEQYGTRFRNIATGDNPRLAAYDQDALVAEGMYNSRALEPVLADLIERDNATADFLQGLDAAAWQHMGVHEERGPTTLAGIVEDYVEHHHLHVRQITRLMEEAD